MEIIIDILLNLSLLIGVGTVVFVGAFAGKMQSTTLWVGKKIAPSDFDSELPRGFQDAITPKMQDTFNTILPIAYVVILAAGTWQMWYLGIALLMAAVVLMIVVQRFYPDKLNVYLRIIIHAMNNKLADYVKNKDPMREEAAREMLGRLEDFYAEIIGQDLKVPPISEAKKMPLGR